MNGDRYVPVFQDGGQGFESDFFHFELGADVLVEDIVNSLGMPVGHNEALVVEDPAEAFGYDFCA